MRHLIPKRGLLGITLVLVLLVSLACSSSSDSAPAAPVVDDTKYGGTLTMPMSGTWLFDPYAAVCGHSWICWGSVGNVHNQLIRTSPNDRSTLEGDLAESWNMSEDGKTYTFKIRDGILDHEGNAFTAEDVWYQFVRVVDQPNGVPGNTQACLRAYINPVRDDAGKLLADAGAEVTGTNEVTVRLKQAKSSFIPCLAGSFVPFLPDTYTKALDDSGAEHRDLDPTKGELIGTGPFKVTEVTVDTKAVWERNPNFFRSGLPYLDRLDIVQMADAQATRANFLAGRLDNMGPGTIGLTDNDMQELSQSLPGQVRLSSMLRLGWKGFELNTATKPFGPQGDPAADDLRTAMQLGFDRQEYNKLITDGKGTLVTPYLPEWSYIGSLDDWYKDAPAFDPDPAVRSKLEAEAVALMEKHGYSESNPLKFGWVCWDRRTTECEAIIGQLERALPVEITPEIVDLGTRTSRSKGGDFQMLETATGSRFNDPDAFNYQMYNLWGDGGRNYASWEDAEWLSLREEQALLTDNVERGKVLRKMGIRVYKGASLVGSVRGTGSHVSRTSLKGWVTRKTTFDTPTFETAWLEK